ncbi:MAG: peptidase M29 [Burkholderiales bacterium]|nr:MAG: peptidase M29 [Burkholderiales bacterium]
MLVERVEPKWVDAFERVLGLCALGPADTVAILSESQSRRVLLDLAGLALARIGCRYFHLSVPTPRLGAPAPVRSTGASEALGGLEPVIAALSQATLVLDCTVEGLLHAPELPRILDGGARLLMVSNEHPEILERLQPDPALEPRVRAAIRLLRESRAMRVVSPHGTDLNVELKADSGDARVGGVWGYCTRPGQVAHWPGGLALAFPPAGSVRGTLVLAPGDVNLTFKQYLRERIALEIEDDHVVAVEGQGVDADLLRGYWKTWEDAEGSRACYAVSHVGWGMNPVARWDALAFYDRRDCNGTELRAFAGNFLYSTGANEVAGRYTLGHFDLPMRGCTVLLDGRPVVERGHLLDEAGADAPGGSR